MANKYTYHNRQKGETMVSKVCLQCKKDFSARLAEVKRGKAMFCSNKCRNQANVGIKFSLARRKKLSDAHTGVKLSPEHIKARVAGQLGENSPNWRGGVTKLPHYKSFYQKRRVIRKMQNGGSHNINEWETLKAQYNWTCPCCHKSEPEIKLSEDHIIPLSKGGSDNIQNIQPLCLTCNIKKSTKVIKYELV